MKATDEIGRKDDDPERIAAQIRGEADQFVEEWTARLAKNPRRRFAMERAAVRLYLRFVGLIMRTIRRGRYPPHSAPKAVRAKGMGSV